MRAFALTALLAVSCTTMRTNDIDRLMADYARPGGPGASVLVVRDGSVVFRKGYGLADVEHGVAATPATHYRLASVTKEFTAAAVMLLVEDGRLRFDDPIRKFLTELPAYAEPITIQHLLTHTSGLVDYEDVIPPGTTVQLKDADVLRLLAEQTSGDFAPGTRYRYSNSGYALLAVIVERASGRSFASFLHDRIFAPLDMATTVAHVDGVDEVRNRAYGTSRAGSGWRRTDQSLTSAVLGDGGVYSSVDDLAHWIAALDAGRFAEAALPRVDTDKPGVRYGYGWRISEHGGARTVWHTGETIGFRNALVRFPDQRLAVVVLTNRDEGEPVDTALAIADLVRRH